MKKRLDILVYEKGFTDSREKAKAYYNVGQVYVDNQKGPTSAELLTMKMLKLK